MQIGFMDCQQLSTSVKSIVDLGPVLFDFHSRVPIGEIISTKKLYTEKYRYFQPIVNFSWIFIYYCKVWRNCLRCKGTNFFIKVQTNDI